MLVLYIFRVISYRIKHVFRETIIQYKTINKCVMRQLARVTLLLSRPIYSEVEGMITNDFNLQTILSTKDNNL